ncbi:MAG: 4-hydroxy-tetrahydrodipicolinate synthase [Rickettsiales bacterium]|jgi:4-hydroxy-tetrahydrodipicolinate synthase|nr:4-hydroxy-tetrahydrodipicolinate synthase [Rickettsiales bacterium]
MFKGIFTALITPFKDNAVDYKAFEQMINWQIKSGVHGLVIAGSTGEGGNLSQEEFLKLVDLAVKIAKNRVSIIANTGVNSTSKTIELTKEAQKLNIDGVMLVAPYYMKPTQEGLYQHFKAIHDASNVPIILYNHPFRSAVEISNEVMVKLSNLSRVVALKDCSANPIKCTELTLGIDDEFNIFSGDDILSLPYYSQGAVGTISSVANIVPSLIVRLYNLWQENKIKEAMELQSILLPLNKVLFCESNPIAVKYAASQFGICSPELRLPLVGPSDENKKLICKTLEDLKKKLK